MEIEHVEPSLRTVYEWVHLASGGGRAFSGNVAITLPYSLMQGKVGAGFVGGPFLLLGFLRLGASRASVSLPFLARFPAFSRAFAFAACCCLMDIGLSTKDLATSIAKPIAGGSDGHLQGSPSPGTVDGGGSSTSR